MNIKRKSTDWVVQDYGYPTIAVGELGPNLSYILDKICPSTKDRLSERLQTFLKKVQYYTSDSRCAEGLAV
jgi:hypothetical protein